MLRALVQTLILLFTLLGAAGAWAEGAQPTKTVALWNFENNTQAGLADLTRVDFLQRALPEMLQAELSTVPGLKLVERVHIREILEEQRLGSSEMASNSSRLKLGRITGARYMIFGNYMAIMEEVRMVVRVVEVETSKILFVDDVSGDMTGLPQLTAQLSKKVAQQFAASKPGDDTTSGSKGDIEVWREYDQGIVLIDERKYPEASKVFEGILAKHPDFTPAQRQLDMTRVGDQFRKGLDLMAAREFDKAVDIFKKVIEMYPDFDPAKEKIKEALKLKRQA